MENIKVIIDMIVENNLKLFPYKSEETLKRLTYIELLRIIEPVGRA